MIIQELMKYNIIVSKINQKYYYKTVEIHVMQCLIDFQNRNLIELEKLEL
jgi:hypothetical protein